MIDAAIAIGSAVLPSLINLIREGLNSGLSEEEATRRALERMAAAELPKPLTQETKDAFAAARERLESEKAKRTPSSPPVVLDEVDRKALSALLRDTQLAPHLSMEARAAIRRAAAIALPTTIEPT